MPSISEIIRSARRAGLGSDALDALQRERAMQEVRAMQVEMMWPSPPSVSEYADAVNAAITARHAYESYAVAEPFAALDIARRSAQAQAMSMNRLSQYHEMVMDADLAKEASDMAITRIDPLFWGLPRERAVEPSVEHLETATAVMERPGGVAFPLPSTLPPDEYMDLAERIGLESPEIVLARLELFFWANNWPVFPYEKVWAYLEQLARLEASRQRAAGVRVFVEPFWAPLRAKDARSFMMKPGAYKDSPLVQAPPYERRVPAHALVKVEALEKQFPPNTLAFFVSDYASVKPDPFLMVLAVGKRYVVDVWDEPGW